MFRLYEIESNREISIATQNFSPANTLTEFAELAKTPMFVERLHAEVLEQMNVFTSPSNTEKHSNNEQPRPNAKRNNGRTYVSATYLPRLNEVLLQLRLGRLPQKINTSRVLPVEINPRIREILRNTTGSIASGAEVTLALLPMYMPCVYVEGYKPLFHGSQNDTQRRYSPRIDIFMTTCLIFGQH